MYTVAGANLFGQWFLKDDIIKEFTTLTEKCVNHNDTDFSLDQAKLVSIHWSYNIFQIDDSFYISGAWLDKENQLMRVTLPDECREITNPHFMLAGSDYYLTLVDTQKKSIWVTDLKMEQTIKKINFGVESPVPATDNSSKRCRRDDGIVKVVAKNNSCMYLTADGKVYLGTLPSYVDTSHCKGKVCDIDCGYEHFILLTDTGRVYTWGNGRRLQLGNGDVYDLDEPTEVEALAGINIIKINAGGWHSLALSEHGDLYTWGWNDTGQLGIKTEPEKENEPGFKKKGLNVSSLPTLIDLFDEDGVEVLLDIKDMACGTRHSVILLEDNSVWTTGCNKYGQLGMSPEKTSKVEYFTKSYQCDDDAILMCGPWSTVLVN